jgi:hypothetical protein
MYPVRKARVLSLESITIGGLNFGCHAIFYYESSTRASDVRGWGPPIQPLRDPANLLVPMLIELR